MDVAIQRLHVGDLPRMCEVDRSEAVSALYVAEPVHEGMGLALTRIPQDPPEQVPEWGDEDVAARTEWWKPELEKGGLFLGALVDGALAGFAILGGRRSDDSAELCALFVGNGHRRAGIGGALVGEIETRARRRRIKAICVHSNPTESAIRFYLKHGYEIIGLFDKSTVTCISGDVVFAKPI